MADAIVCEELTKLYGTRAVVNKLSLRVPENIVFGFLGPNGAGKSTSMRLLTGQIKPNSGSATVAGINVITDQVQSHRQIGYLSEMPNFYPWMKGRELLEFVGEVFGMKPADRRARAKELLKLVGIADAGNRKVGTYSGGMRQRLGIAQALVNRPRVIFLDEPVSALDPIGRRDVLTLLSNIRQEATVFMSSHVLADVDRVCEQVAILDQGKLVIAGDTTQVKEQYAMPLLEIEVEGGHQASQKLAENLHTNGKIKKLIPTENGRLHIEMVDDAAVRDAGHYLPRVIADLNLTLLSFNAVIPNLEDVFVKLVGESEAKGGHE
ncbi:MAG TPA: ABC transporter ATP-binding protein [Chloroflexia bacterium]|nr:ABC transporter ATP-binding protein [Chloroflexia bacterium]